MVIDDAFLACEADPNLDRAPARVSLAPVLSRDDRRELRLIGSF